MHITANHLWLTTDRGWAHAGDLRPGERVVALPAASGQAGSAGSVGSAATATVAWVRVAPGAAAMDNLTVAQDHTYAVGDGRYVVHNDPDPTQFPLLGQGISTEGSGIITTVYPQWTGREGPATFKTGLSSDGSTLTLYEAFRETMPESIRASDILTEQARYLGANSTLLTRVELDTIIDNKSLGRILYGGARLGETRVGGLAANVIDNLGMEITGDPLGQVGPMIRDSSVRGGKYVNGWFDVQPTSACP